jgi:hypothetical protein
MTKATQTLSGPTRAAFGVAALVAAILVLATAVAQAADVIFPAGSRLGVVPPVGMVPSRNFMGFEDPDKNAAILLTTLPAQAYVQLEKSMVPDALRKQGVDIDKREPIQFSFGKGFLLSGKQTANNVRYRKWLLIAAAGDITALVTVQVPEQDIGYPDKAIRDAIASLAVRPAVPDAERLSLLPFKVGDLAGFKVEDVLPGRALMLVDKMSSTTADANADRGKDAAKTQDHSQGQSKELSLEQNKGQGAPANPPSLNARFFIGAMPGGPAQPEDRDNFARVLFQQIGGVKDIQITDAEPLRINNQSGYETLAKAKESQSDIDVMVVQWLRFGTGGFLQMVGIARADLWPDIFTRLRTVRDGIDPK